MGFAFRVMLQLWSLRILDARPATAVFGVLWHLLLLIHFLLLMFVRKMMPISSVSLEESFYRIPVFISALWGMSLERTFSSGRWFLCRGVDKIFCLPKCDSQWHCVLGNKWIDSWVGVFVEVLAEPYSHIGIGRKPALTLLFVLVCWEARKEFEWREWVPSHSSETVFCGLSPDLCASVCYHVVPPGALGRWFGVCKPSHRVVSVHHCFIIGAKLLA